MDKQDPLADVICRAMFDQPLGELHPITDAGCVKAAAAVRSYMGSDEVVERAASAIAPLVNEDMAEPFKSAWTGDLARAALSAALDIGGGRG